MKIQLGNDLGSYSFVASTKTVTLAIPSFNITADDILGIFNQVTGTPLYVSGIAAFAPASVTPSVGSTVFVANAGVSNAGMSNGDPLLIYINVPASTDLSSKVTVNDGAILVEILKTLQYIANPMTVDQVNSRQRVLLDSITGSLTLATVTTVGTVNTVTNQSQMGGIQANSMIHDFMHNVWVNAIRNRIS